MEKPEPSLHLNATCGHGQVGKESLSLCLDLDLHVFNFSLLSWVGTSDFSLPFFFPECLFLPSPADLSRKSLLVFAAASCREQARIPVGSVTREK